MLRALAIAATLAAAAPAARGGGAVVPAAVRQELGAPTRLEDLRGPGSRPARDLIGLIRRTYGVDAGSVPVYLLGPRGLREAYRLATRQGPRDRVRGFEVRGVVYVNREQTDFIETLAHELLHALSQKFSGQAGARGYHAFVEGMTQHLTRRTGISEATRRMGVRRGTAYGMYVRFAERLAELVGDDALADCYFRRGYLELERQVNALAGAGHMDLAMRHLASDDLAGALRALGQDAQSPLDGVWFDR